MLVNECEGGDSSIVDAFGVVDGLRRDHPEKFDALCAVPVPFRLFSDDDESYAVSPVVDLDAAGSVRLVRFNTQQMQTGCGSGIPRPCAGTSGFSWTPCSASSWSRSRPASFQAEQQSQAFIDSRELVATDATEDPGNPPLVDGTDLIHQCV